MICKNCYGHCDQYFGPKDWCRYCYFEEEYAREDKLKKRRDDALRRQIGSQIRDVIEDTEYTVVSIEGEEAVLLNNNTREKELWVENDHHAGYTIDIEGKGYEFVRGV